MKHLQLLLLALAGLASTVALAEGPSPAGRDAARMGAALIAGDYATVAALTHPKVVERAGGTAAVVRLLQDANKDLVTHTMKFSRPRQLSQVQGTWIALFPYRSRVSVDKHIVNIRSFFIGFSPDQHNWKFIDCTGITQQYLAQLLPGYNGNLDLKGC